MKYIYFKPTFRLPKILFQCLPGLTDNNSPGKCLRVWISLKESLNIQFQPIREQYRSQLTNHRPKKKLGTSFLANLLGNESNGSHQERDKEHIDTNSEGRVPILRNIKIGVAAGVESTYIQFRSFLLVSRTGFYLNQTQTEQILTVYWCWTLTEANNGTMPFCPGG